MYQDLVLVAVVHYDNILKFGLSCIGLGLALLVFGLWRRRHG